VCADPLREVDADTMSKVKTLYVSNINLCVTPEQLQGYYCQFGEEINCVIVKNSQGMSKGFAFVEFEHRADCEQAMKYTKNHTFCGQPLNVVLAKPPPGGGPGIFGSLQAKQQRMGITSLNKPNRSGGRTGSRGGRSRGGRGQYDDSSSWDGAYNQSYNPNFKQNFNPRNFSYAQNVGFTGSQSPYQNPNQYNQNYMSYSQPGYQGSYQYPDQSTYNHVYNTQGYQGSSVTGYLPPGSGNYNPQGGYNQAYYGYNPQGGYSQSFSSNSLQSYSQPYGTGYPPATSAYQSVSDPITAGVYPHPPADSAENT